MAKRISISPTDEFTSNVTAYAKEHGISVSMATAKLASIGLEVETGKRVKASQKHGDVSRINRMKKTYQCLWCKHEFTTAVAMECPNCGEDEFQIIS